MIQFCKFKQKIAMPGESKKVGLKKCMFLLHLERTKFYFVDYLLNVPGAA